jgi:transposase
MGQGLQTSCFASTTMPVSSSRAPLCKRLTPIQYRSNAKNRPKFFPKLLYKTRARIEQAIGKLKRFKRVAMCCEKTAESYYDPGLGN